jgi:hypothetical protein
MLLSDQCQRKLLGAVGQNECCVLDIVLAYALGPNFDSDIEWRIGSSRAAFDECIIGDFGNGILPDNDVSDMCTCRPQLRWVEEGFISDVKEEAPEVSSILLVIE